MAATRHILMISGSLRVGSSNEAALRTAAQVAPDGITSRLFDGLGNLPHFNPDDDHEPLHPAVVELRAAIGAADAVLLCTPEYAGALPGSFKNLLDWTIGGGALYGKPVGWINISATTGAPHAHASLRTVLGYAGADMVEAACVHIPVPRDIIDANGIVADPARRAEITGVLTALANHVASRDNAERARG